MTLQRLNQYRAIKREIPDLKKRIKKQKQQIGAFSSVMGSSPEPPYTLHSIPVDSASFADMSETLAIMQKRLRRITRQRKEIESYIDGIEDSQLRQIFQLRFVDGLPWENVTIEIGGGNAEKSVKQRVYRHLKFEDQCHKKA